ncbi:mitochondrial ribosome-associated GTPase 2 [Lingula anatina]|uniref:Mitochondrial ribosome-associated GTPase 2 n=1 Tax=Lingula anatina TaxID=7574 RepID=A0A1S3IV74_LINAN|nr:mitochondrial ribosome-associated GTPase 2 [Lingula anatina]|eukprot:XP_013402100.1 mitochondrial ribosome-associated GTPase 2 [Lingula anatina]
MLVFDWSGRREATFAADNFRIYGKCQGWYSQEMLKNICQQCHLLQSVRTAILRHCSTDVASHKLATKKVKTRAAGNTNESFADHCKVRVRGGNGGDGSMVFLRQAFKEFGGPAGGDGGNGGHVIFRASNKISNLNLVRAVYQADEGGRGEGNCCHGKSAEHLYIEVPTGTIFKELETQKLVADLSSEGDMFLAARGGAGGRGNHFFLSNEMRVPRICEEGGRGEEEQYLVELRVMANAGLIGFPNAGKSTLLRALSRARPKVASYAFTTRKPHIGMVQYDDYAQVSVADIPGLVTDAHKNRGLGFSFLRHIQRCSCLLYVLDLSQEEPWQQLKDLKYELEQFETGLSERPHAIIGNKIDLPKARKNLDLLREKVQLPVYPVSAKFLLNIEELKCHIRKIYDEHIDKS